MTEEEKKTITREKHPGSVAQPHKLAALMKKRKEEVLRNKEQGTEQGTEQSKEQSTVQSTVQSKEQSTAQSKEQSAEQGKEQSTSNTYIYGVGMVAWLAIGVCVFFAYNTFPTKQANDRSTDQHEQKQQPKRRHML